MKIYIKASDMFTNTPFKKTTGTSYGDNYLTDLKHMQEAKNRTGNIVMMSPNEYFAECAEHGFDRKVTVDSLKKQREYDSDLNEKYKKLMQNGTKFDMCYINYADHTQEGLHRMMVAGDLYGWNTKFPVLVINVYDQEREDEWKKIDAFNDFTRFTFKHICQEAANNIVVKYDNLSDNFTELLHDEIIEVSKDFEDESYDIDVDIDIEELDGDHRVTIYVSRFFDYEPEVYSNPAELWLENLYDMNRELTDEEINESLPDDIDDIDISDLFFKD